jgi:hypothetical protein
MSELQIELVWFLTGLSVADGGLGKAEHFWNVMAMLWPVTAYKRSFVTRGGNGWWMSGVIPMPVS